MYRLTCYGDEEYENPDVKYIRIVASNTVANGLRFAFGKMEEGDVIFQAIVGAFSAAGFFDGFAQYVSMTDDDRAGEELVRCKVQRMIEKAEDPQEDYVFDVFEELLLYEAIKHCKDFYRFSKAGKTILCDKEKERQIARKLVEEYHYHVKHAAKISRDISCFYQMGLKENQDENMFFWDRDYEMVFHDGFLEGIRFLKSIAGENAGYGYDYAWEIFTDIGMKAPLLLLGTREANRIANEMSWKKVLEQLDGVIPQVPKKKWKEDNLEEDDLPYV